MNHPYPRLVVAALRGGAGKTVIAVALAVLLRRRGIEVVPFKKGPDYIDAAWLSRAASSPCFNLDTYLMGREEVCRSFSRRAAGGLSLIEGNRGLYDGMNLDGEHSTAGLSKLLKAPVILVADCDKSTRTMAAMVLGCQHLDPEVDLRGVILNRVGNSRHADLVQRSIETICKLPVLGIIPRQEGLLVPERHLGLIPPQEHEQVAEVLAKIGDIAGKCLDLEGLIQVAQRAPYWEAAGDVPPSHRPDGGTVTIGVITDSAFQFYYRENIEALVDAGARVVQISALDDKLLPPVDGLYIGGGFPETHLRPLAENYSFRRALREAIEDGLPVYAECGGLIYLGESVAVEDSKYPLVGALPLSFVVAKRPQGHGYTLLEVDQENPFFPPGTMIKGHEFRYSRIISETVDDRSLVCRMERGTGINGRRDGMVYKNVLALFTHLHALGTPQWVEGMIKRAKWYRDKKNKISRRSLICHLLN